MPGTRCAVAVCNNNLLQTKKDNLKIVYHKFPKNEEICEAWAQACQRTNKWNPRTSAICSQHFKNEDYETDLKARLLNIPIRPRLKPSAVPTLLLTSNGTENTTKSSVDNSKKKFSRKRQKVVEEEILECNDNSLDCATLPETSYDLIQVVEYTKEDYDKLLQEHEELKEKYQGLQEEYKEQTRQLENTEKLLTNLTKKYHNEEEKEEITVGESWLINRRRDE